MNSNENFVTIRSYHDHILADIVMAALHNAGIETFTLDENRGILPFENVDIKVHQNDVAAALEIIENQESL